MGQVAEGHLPLLLLLLNARLTLAKECMISDRTSESGSVPMDFMSASHMKCHIWVRYSGPRTCAHSSRRGIDSAAATRTRGAVQENTHRCERFLPGPWVGVICCETVAGVIKDIIMEVKLEKGDHQLHHLLCILHKTLLQLFGITHLQTQAHRVNVDTRIFFMSSPRSLRSARSPASDRQWPSPPAQPS